MEQRLVEFAMALFCIISLLLYLVERGQKINRGLLNRIVYLTAYFMRYFWLNSKLAETGACDSPSLYHKFKFSTVPVYNCDLSGIYAAYSGTVPCVKDGLLFYNKHAHYQTGDTPLELVWKDKNCSQYVIDTDGKGEVLSQQQIVLELQDDGKLSTSDVPPVIFGYLDGEFIQKSELRSDSLLKFAIGDGGMSFVHGKLEKADLNYLGKSPRTCIFADSYSKLYFNTWFDTLL